MNIRGGCGSPTTGRSWVQRSSSADAAANSDRRASARRARRGPRARPRRPQPDSVWGDPSSEKRRAENMPTFRRGRRGGTSNRIAAAGAAGGTRRTESAASIGYLSPASAAPRSPGSTRTKCWRSSRHLARQKAETARAVRQRNPVGPWSERSRWTAQRQPVRHGRGPTVMELLRRRRRG